VVHDGRNDFLADSGFFAEAVEKGLNDPVGLGSDREAADDCLLSHGLMALVVLPTRFFVPVVMRFQVDGPFERFLVAVVEGHFGIRLKPEPPSLTRALVGDLPFLANGFKLGTPQPSAEAVEPTVSPATSVMQANRRGVEVQSFEMQEFTAVLLPWTAARNDGRTSLRGGRTLAEYAESEKSVFSDWRVTTLFVEAC
jgi:hypothetical protein